MFCLLCLHIVILVYGIPVLFVLVVIAAATDDAARCGGDIDDDYLTYYTSVYYVVLRALWKIDVNLISTLVNKSLYYNRLIYSFIKPRWNSLINE